MKLILDDLAVKSGVRHVRTPGGAEKYGEPIGSVITRDAIEHAANKTERAAGAADKPSAGGGGVSKAEGPDAEAIVHPERQALIRRVTTDRLVQADPKLNEALDLVADDIIAPEEVDAEEAAARDRAEKLIQSNQKVLAAVLPSADVFVQVRAKALPVIIKSGRFKNVHDEDTHGFRAADLHEMAASQEDRARFEQDTFGDSKPVYGYLSSRPYGANHLRPESVNGSVGDTASVRRDYGIVAVKLKRDRVVQRTTFTLGDSFGDQESVAPSAVTKPDAVSVGDKDITGATSIDEVVNKADASYAEAQIHGDLTLDDIEEVSFADFVEDDVLKALEAAGIKYILDAGVDDADKRSASEQKDIVRKLVLVDLLPELDEKGVRHVRTPEGVRKYGQPIGAVITRDVINRERRKRGLKPLPDAGGGSSSDKKPSRPSAGGGKTPAPKHKLTVQDSGPKKDAGVTRRKKAAEPLDAAVLTGRGRAEGAGTEQDPIDVKGDIDRAVQLLGEGKHIRLNRPREASTLVKKLHDQVAEMRAQGKEAPTFDLCKVSVPKTNLFCAQHKGVPRAQMPQVAGRAAPGSKAEQIARERGTSGNGKVDLTPEFRAALADAGVGVKQESIRASRLHASQMELDGETVAAIPDAIRSGAIPADARIAVTRDGYILDGHHRWASRVYEDIEDDQLGDLSIDADVLDMDIGAAIDFANRFARDMGIAPESLSPSRDGSADALSVSAPGKPEVEDVRAGDLSIGDSIVIDSKVGHVDDVTTFDNGDMAVDLTYKDGTKDYVYVDPSEILTRVSGIPEGDGSPPDPAPVPVPEPDRTGVTAKDLRPGDRFRVPSGQVHTVLKVEPVDGEPTVMVTTRDNTGNEATLPFGGAAKLELIPRPEEVYTPADKVKVGDQIADDDGAPLTVVAVRKNRSTGLYDITTNSLTGQRDTNSFSDQVALARVREAMTPDALPERAASGRVALATYQRKNLAILDLDHDEAMSDEVRQAASRIRLKQNVTAEQSAALSAHLRQLADEEKRPQRQRALRRMAGQVGAVDATLRGEDVPTVDAVDRMDKSTVGDVGEGDWIAIRDQAGGDTAQIGKITGVKSLMGGRLREVTLTDPQGNETKRVLTPNTVAYVLPDLPDPKPVTPSEGAGPVDIGEVGRGDTVMVRDNERGGMTEMLISEISRMSGGGKYLTGTRTVDGSRMSQMVAAGTTVNRTELNPAKPLKHNEVQVGDRVDYAATLGFTKINGFVTGVEKTTGTNESGDPVEGVYIDVRNDSGRISRISLYADDSPDVLRLVTRDPQAAADFERRIANEKRERAVHEVAGRMGHMNRRTEMDVAEALGHALIRIGARGSAGDHKPLDQQDLIQALAQDRQFQQRLATTRLDAAGRVSRALGDFDATQTTAIQESLAPALVESQQRAIRRTVEAVAGAEPRYSTETYAQARGAMVYRLRDPSGADPELLDSDYTAARSLIAAGKALADFLPPEPKQDGPTQIVGDTLAEKVASARAILGGTGDGFGKDIKQVAAFESVTLADLEAGKVPKVVTTTAGVSSRAADGGPADTAMQHLHVVKQVGAAIREDVDRRVKAELANLPGADKLAQQQKDAAAAQIRAGAQREAALRAATDVVWAKQGTTTTQAEGMIQRLDGQYRLARQRYVMTRNVEDQQEMARLSREVIAQREKVDGVVREAKRDPNYMQVNADYTAALTENSRVGAEIRALEPQRRKVLSDVRKKVLSEIRRVGGHKLSYDKGERARETKVMRWAEEFYPADWLEHADTTQLHLKTIKRGHYQHATATIAISGGYDGAEYSRSWAKGTAIHELGHRMERQVPGLLAAEEAFLWHRTSTGGVGERKRTPLTRIYSGDKEIGFKDEFKEHYTGKTYGGQAYEVFTTGVESMFAGSPYADGDEDFQDFMMGVLATL